MRARARVSASMRACVRACARACMRARARVRACVRACVRVCVSVVMVAQTRRASFPKIRLQGMGSVGYRPEEFDCRSATCTEQKKEKIRTHVCVLRHPGQIYLFDVYWNICMYVYRWQGYLYFCDMLNMFGCVRACVHASACVRP